MTVENCELWNDANECLSVQMAGVGGWPGTTKSSYKRGTHSMGSRVLALPVRLYSLLDLPQVKEEVRELFRIAGPAIVANFLVYVRSMVSMACLGRIGQLEQAGGVLSLGLTNITGYSVLFGLATGLDPVCSQAFGSKNYGLVSLTVQRTFLILVCVSIPISVAWINSEWILVHLGQKADISAVASTYCIYSLLDLPINCVLQPLRVYLRSQGITSPMMWCSILAILLHVPINVVLVFVLKLGVPGVALASVWTNFNMTFFLLSYVWFSGVYKHTWVPWSRNCWRGWRPVLGLAIASCSAICLEWWWYEIITILAGYLPDAEAAVAATGVVIQTTALMYTVPLSLSSSVCTRVGIELGANRPSKARLSAFVALFFSCLAAVINVVWTSTFPRRWAAFFAKGQESLSLAAAIVPFIGICELGNCPQTTGCGVLRGCAKTSAAVKINFGAFYGVGMPVAIVSALVAKLGFAGLWHGLLAAQIVCVVWVLMSVLKIDWLAEAQEAKQLTAKSKEKDSKSLDNSDQPLISVPAADGEGNDVEANHSLIVKPEEMRV